MSLTNFMAIVLIPFSTNADFYEVVLAHYTTQFTEWTYVDPDKPSYEGYTSIRTSRTKRGAAKDRHPENPDGEGIEWILLPIESEMPHTLGGAYVGTTGADRHIGSTKGYIFGANKKLLEKPGRVVAEGGEDEKARLLKVMMALKQLLTGFTQAERDELQQMEELLQEMEQVTANLAEFVGETSAKGESRRLQQDNEASPSVGYFEEYGWVQWIKRFEPSKGQKVLMSMAGTALVGIIVCIMFRLFIQ